MSSAAGGGASGSGASGSGAGAGAGAGAGGSGAGAGAGGSGVGSGYAVRTLARLPLPMDDVHMNPVLKYVDTWEFDSADRTLFIDEDVELGTDVPVTYTNFTFPAVDMEVFVGFWTRILADRQRDVRVFTPNGGDAGRMPMHEAWEHMEGNPRTSTDWIDTAGYGLTFLNMGVKDRIGRVGELSVKLVPDVLAHREGIRLLAAGHRSTFRPDWPFFMPIYITVLQGRVRLIQYHGAGESLRADVPMYDRLERHVASDATWDFMVGVSRDRDVLQEGALCLFGSTCSACVCLRNMIVLGVVQVCLALCVLGIGMLCMLRRTPYWLCGGSCPEPWRGFGPLHPLPFTLLPGGSPLCLIG